jgi:magnesium-transporting ATPase (P-type)
VIISLTIQEWLDAAFIFAVLLINAIIGGIQEHSAARAASALSKLVTSRTRVQRDDDAYEIDARELVPGNIVLLELGAQIPADIRLLTSHNLEIDDSLLTGESIAVLKRADQILDVDTQLTDRINMVFTSTFVARGRAQGIVVNTAAATEVGHIAMDVVGGRTTKAPLIVRMESFTQRIAIIIGIEAIVMAAIAFSRGMPVSEIFLLAVALAVPTIPEGLPVALTIVLVQCGDALYGSPKCNCTSFGGDGSTWLVYLYCYR